MYRHPYATSSLLRCNTLFGNKDDNGAIDMRNERTVDTQPYMTYLKRWDECLGISRSIVSRSARRLEPVEIQFQAISELVHYHALKHRSNHRISPLDPPFLRTLGTELANAVQSQIENYESYQTKPKSWMDSIVQMLDTSGTYSTARFEREVFQLLLEHWKKQGYVRDHDADVIEEDIANMDDTDISYIMDQEVERPKSLWNALLTNTDKEHTQPGIHPQRTLGIASLDVINRNLDKYGVAVVRNVIDDENIDFIRKILHLNSSMARDGAFKIMNDDANVPIVKATRGRIHCLLKGTSFDKQIIPLQNFWMPLIYYIFGSQFYTSSVILVSTDAMSFVEPWHRNNRNFGVTVVLALDSVDENNGRIQFLPGTHKTQPEINPYKFGKVGVDLNRGDVLIFDSRVLHRNTINESNKCCSCLVFSYDYTSTPPPGQGALQFMLDKWRGVFIDLVSKPPRHTAAHG